MHRTATASFLTASTIALALVCFGVAALLSDAPSVAPSTAPTAEAVRRARGAAVELAMALAADGTPRRVQLSRHDLEASAMLVGHGFDGLRFRPAIDGDSFAPRASIQLTDATWINIGGHVSSGDSAFPDVTIDVGAWRFPPVVVRGVLRLADNVARWRGYALPPMTSMVRDVAVQGDAVAATFAVPQQLFDVARKIVGSTGPTVDPQEVEAIYRQLIGAKLAPDAPLAAALRVAFDHGSDVDDVTGRNRAAFIALAMYAVGPAVQRLAGSDVEFDVPPAPGSLTLGGRPDLAKHFTLSAALAATIDPRFTRAIGEWKELDDSLPGGSGFSFVDLTADRAGLHIARAALDSATAEAVAERLAATQDSELFPSAAHRFAEGLSEAEFSRQYGSLEAGRYAQAIRRVDRLLDRLPLYAPYIAS